MKTPSPLPSGRPVMIRVPPFPPVSIQSRRWPSGAQGRRARLLAREARERRPGRIVPRRPRNPAIQAEDPGEAAPEGEREPAPVGGELDVAELLDAGQGLADVEEERFPAGPQVVA